MDRLAIYMRIGQAPEHRRHPRTSRHSIPIIVNTMNQESIQELTPIIQPRPRAISHLILPVATLRIPGKVMALGVGTGLCTHLRLTQVGRVPCPLWIKHQSHCMRRWPR